MAARFSGGWPFGRIIGVGLLIVGLFSLLAIGVGGTALADLTTARNRVVNTLDPAAFHASQLEVDLLNQETGVRGYALSAQPSFLTPYHNGMTGQQQQVARLRQLLASMPAAQAYLSQVQQRAAVWRATYAVPTIHQVTVSGKPPTGPTGDLGKADFDRSAGRARPHLQNDLTAQRIQAAAALQDAASVAAGDPHRHRGRAAGHRAGAGVRTVAIGDPAAVPARLGRPPGGRRATSSTRWSRAARPRCGPWGLT